MGWDPKTIPQSALRRMSKEGRKPLGKSGHLNEEAHALIDRRTERQLQEQIAGLFRQRGLFFIQARMDKRTTTRKGLFDFTVFIPNRSKDSRIETPPLALAIECKTESGKLSREQIEVCEEFERKNNYPVHVIRSLSQFKELIDLYHP